MTGAEFCSLYMEYLQNRGLTASRIKAQKYKTPDLKVFGENTFQLNEIKIPELIFEPLQEVYAFNTTHSKVLTFISTALRQFESYDNERRVPWVVTFGSNHFQMN